MSEFVKELEGHHLVGYSCMGIADPVHQVFSPYAYELQYDCSSGTQDEGIQTIELSVLENLMNTKISPSNCTVDPATSPFGLVGISSRPRDKDVSRQSCTKFARHDTKCCVVIQGNMSLTSLNRIDDMDDVFSMTYDALIASNGTSGYSIAYLRAILNQGDLLGSETDLASVVVANTGQNITPYGFFILGFLAFCFLVSLLVCIFQCCRNNRQERYNMESIHDIESGLNKSDSTKSSHEEYVENSLVLAEEEEANNVSVDSMAVAVAKPAAVVSKDAYLETGVVVLEDEMDGESVDSMIPPRSLPVARLVAIRDVCAATEIGRRTVCRNEGVEDQINRDIMNHLEDTFCIELCGFTSTSQLLAATPAVFKEACLGTETVLEEENDMPGYSMIPRPLVAAKPAVFEEEACAETEIVLEEEKGIPVDSVMPPKSLSICMPAVLEEEAGAETEIVLEEGKGMPVNSMIPPKSLPATMPVEIKNARAETEIGKQTVCQNEDKEEEEQFNRAILDHLNNTFCVELCGLTTSTGTQSLEKLQQAMVGMNNASPKNQAKRAHSF